MSLHVNLFFFCHIILPVNMRRGKNYLRSLVFLLVLTVSIFSGSQFRVSIRSRNLKSQKVSGSQRKTLVSLSHKVPNLPFVIHVQKNISKKFREIRLHYAKHRVTKTEQFLKTLTPALINTTSSHLKGFVNSEIGQNFNHFVPESVLKCLWTEYLNEV